MELSTTARDRYDYVFAEAAFSGFEAPMELAPREVHIRVALYARWELLP
jgi:hypothetical protein